MLKHEVWKRKKKLKHNLFRAMKMQNKLEIKKMYSTIHFTVMKHMNIDIKTAQLKFIDSINKTIGQILLKDKF